MAGGHKADLGSNLLIGLLLLFAACHRGPGAIAALENGVRLRADSAQYSVRVDGPMYLATIGFQFQNNSGRTLSQNYCQSPSPPTLEKQWANGAWAFAYSGVELTCRTSPPFRIADGGTYRGTIRLAAGRRGTNVFPRFGPDSVPGMYRLRWELRASADPDDRAAPMLAAVSPPFTLVIP